jgi:hypothetical protein
MSEEAEKSIEDLKQILDTLSVKIGEIKMPEFTMLSEKLGTLEKKKQGIVDKLNEARDTLHEKINEATTDS